MKKEDLRIVYMGTPDFAVEALRQLVEGGYNVVGVITMPDQTGRTRTQNSIFSCQAICTRTELAVAATGETEG